MDNMLQTNARRIREHSRKLKEEIEELWNEFIMLLTDYKSSPECGEGRKIVLQEIEQKPDEAMTEEDLDGFASFSFGFIKYYPVAIDLADGMKLYAFEFNTLDGVVSDEPFMLDLDGFFEDGEISYLAEMSGGFPPVLAELFMKAVGIPAE